jgi:hypothetical protein
MNMKSLFKYGGTRKNRRSRKSRKTRRGGSPGTRRV